MPSTVLIAAFLSEIALLLEIMITIFRFLEYCEHIVG